MITLKDAVAHLFQLAEEHGKDPIAELRESLADKDVDDRAVARVALAGIESSETAGATLIAERLNAALASDPVGVSDMFMHRFPVSKDLVGIYPRPGDDGSCSSSFLGIINSIILGSTASRIVVSFDMEVGRVISFAVAPAPPAPVDEVDK